MSDPQLYGLAGVVAGLAMMIGCRQFGRAYTATEQAQSAAAEFLSPRRARGFVGLWARADDADTPGGRFLRAYVFFAAGLIVFVVGLVALLGAFG